MSPVEAGGEPPCSAKAAHTQGRASPARRSGHAWSSLEWFRGVRGRGEEESDCTIFAILDTLILHAETSRTSFIAQ